MKSFKYVNLNGQSDIIDADTWDNHDGWFSFFRYDVKDGQLPMKHAVLTVRADALFSVGEVFDGPQEAPAGSAG